MNFQTVYIYVVIGEDTEDAIFEGYSSNVRNNPFRSRLLNAYILRWGPTDDNSNEYAFYIVVEDDF